MEKLGIDVRLLLAQIVNFSIITFILAKFLYKPVLSFIKKRQMKINEGLALSEKMEKEREKLDTDREKVLKKAREEASQIIKNAKTDGKKIQEEIKAKAKEEITALRKDVNAQLTIEREKIEKDVAQHTVMIAQKMVEQLIGDILNKQEHKKLIDKQLIQLKRKYQKVN